MKKILVLPAIIGLLAVPSLAMAQHGADDNNPKGARHDVRREDRRNDKVTQSTTGTNLQNNSIRGNEVGDDNNQPPVTLPVGSISLDQAKAIALGVSTGKTVQKVEIEKEHGVIIYSVRFTDGSRVDVQADNGAIVRSELETENDDSSGSSHSDGVEDNNHSDGSNQGSDDN